MNDCMFCKIVKGEIPCYKVYEDKDNLAFLTIFPTVKGQTVVISKKHLSSVLTDLNDKDYAKLMLASKKVSELLNKKLGSKRTGMIVEGTGVDHAHTKLYPLYYKDPKNPPTKLEPRVFFKEYEGYMTSLEGPKANQDDLNKLASQIRNS